MALHILRTPDDALLPRQALTLLAHASEASQEVMVLVPDQARADQVRRSLASTSSALGARVCTPSVWVRDAWHLYGDGTELVERGVRRLLVRRALLDAPAFGEGGLDHGPGTLDLVCQVVAHHLPDLPLRPDGGLDAEALAARDLADAERALLAVVDAYLGLLRDHHLTEPCMALLGAPALVAAACGGAGTGQVLSVGFDAMGPEVRSFVVSLSRESSVEVLLPAAHGPAYAAVERLAHDLVAAAVDAGIEADSSDCEDAGAIGVAGTSSDGRAPELASLCDTIFRIGERDVPPVEPTGAASLLEPSGPSAEAELVCQRVDGLAQAGASRVVVVTPDVASAWRELAPKLAARGLSVRATLARPFAGTSAGGALLGWLRTVAHLSELAATWPVLSDDASSLSLGPMDWWPPRDLTDFLLSPVSGVGAGAAWRLDATWRGDRLLTPKMVLSTLSKPSRTSAACAQATQDLLKGRVGTAAHDLMRGLEPPQGEDADGCEGPCAVSPAVPSAVPGAEVTGALAALADAAESLRAAGISPTHAPLVEVVSAVTCVLADATVTMRPTLDVPGSTCAVELLSPQAASALPAASADAVAIMGLTTELAPLAASDDALSLLLGDLGLDVGTDPLERARLLFMRQLRVPRTRLLLERPLYDAASKPTYPAVMLSELLGAYGVADDDDARPLACVSHGEDAICENLSPAGASPQAQAVDEPAEAGELTGAAASFVVVPRNGEASLPDGRPSLSASQVEVYLECPYKWFSLRRLGLEDVDAGFGGMEMGTFAHRVLEVTRTRMLADATHAAGLVGEDGMPVDVPSDPCLRVPGSRVEASSLAHATELLDAEFDEHRAHQYHKAHRPQDQALVPHTQTEGYLLDQLRHDLHSELSFEGGLFEGFEPRFFELRFGGRSGVPVTYAGADFVGSIDRVDVDEAGHALVIDYKHKAPAALMGEYPLWPSSGAPDAFVLPRRVQTLINASAAPACLPGLTVVGSVYLGTKGN
ncbi:MAG: PD-(D/E)XK nuclease family protein, partial [Atopobiaceae bacterium]|nr:PD-(D/E)XK nuclease family protein [Atopobiaceae bacterium]